MMTAVIIINVEGKVRSWKYGLSNKEEAYKLKYVENAGSIISNIISPKGPQKVEELR
jgi:hypothetical protein